MMKRLLVGILFLSLAANRSAAQTIPLLSGEVTIGNGGHTRHTSTGVSYYDYDGMALVRFATAIRLGGPGTLRPVLVIERSPNMNAPNGDLVSLDCAVNHNCDRFPTPFGSAGGLGVEWLLASRLTFGAAAGIGFYQRRAAFGDLNAAVKLFPHLSLSADGRLIRWSSSDRQALAYFPLSCGVRLF